MTANRRAPRYHKSLSNCRCASLQSDRCRRCTGGGAGRQSEGYRGQPARDGCVWAGAGLFRDARERLVFAKPRGTQSWNRRRGGAAVVAANPRIRGAVASTRDITRPSKYPRGSRGGAATRPRTTHVASVAAKTRVRSRYRTNAAGPTKLGRNFPPWTIFPRRGRMNAERDRPTPALWPRDLHASRGIFSGVDTGPPSTTTRSRNKRNARSWA